jgi:hypothetical protein
MAFLRESKSDCKLTFTICVQMQHSTVQSVQANVYWLLPCRLCCSSREDPWALMSLRLTELSSDPTSSIFHLTVDLRATIWAPEPLVIEVSRWYPGYLRVSCSKHDKAWSPYGCNGREVFVVNDYYACFHMVHFRKLNPMIQTTVDFWKTISKFIKMLLGSML